MQITPALIAFDADDTLWHNERFFQLTQARFAELLADYADPDGLDRRLMAAERKNLGTYGFGIKSFMLSMIETALEVTEHRVPGHVIAAIIEAGQEMLAHPIELLPGVAETLAALAGRRMMVITKGDLLDQERKVAQSGLGDLFSAVEIVSAKTPPVYAAVCARQGVAPGELLMVGNSMASDILPVLELGGWAAYVPQPLAWPLEDAPPPKRNPRFVELSGMGDLLPLLT